MHTPSVLAQRIVAAFQHEHGGCIEWPVSQVRMVEWTVQRVLDEDAIGKGDPRNLTKEPLSAETLLPGETSPPGPGFEKSLSPVLEFAKKHGLMNHQI